MDVGVVAGTVMKHSFASLDSLFCAQKLRKKITKWFWE
jgi:hypothetical protein